MSETFARGFKTWSEKVAVEQRRQLGLRPWDPLDPHRLAEHLGILVWYADQIPAENPGWRRVLLRDDPDSWSTVTLHLGRNDLIILNPIHRKGRESSNLMHELAHTLAGHDPAEAGVSAQGPILLATYNKSQEDEANWLAGTLLLPREALIHIRSTGLSELEAGQVYGVSQQMLRWRIDVTGVDYQLKLKGRRKFS